MSDSDNLASVRVSVPNCLMCGKPVVARYRPFCSQRCADLDLGRWLNESYRVPTNESPEDSLIPDALIADDDDDLDH